MCITRLLFSVVLGAAVFAWSADSPVVASQASAGSAADPVLGIWHLNVAKSKYSPGPAPKSQSRTYEANKDGVKTTIRTVYADGNTASIQYVAAYDGMEYPLTGSVDSDAIALKRFDLYTAESTLMHGTVVMGTARRVISKDGKTMTMSYEGIRQGQRVNDVMVYEKEEK